MKSFAILRTNVGLTTNIKIMVDSSYNLSLSSIESNDELANTKFKKVSFTQKIEWPLPSFFKKKIKIFMNLKNNKNITFSKKFGFYIAYTRVAICKI